jgi:hypothetical protein
MGKRQTMEEWTRKLEASIADRLANGDAQDLARARRTRGFDIELHSADFWKSSGLAFDTPSTFAEVYPRLLRPLLDQCEECIVLGQSEPSANAYYRAAWDAAGAVIERWYPRHFYDEGGVRKLRLTDEVLNDVLFWWWLLPGRSGFHLVLITTRSRLIATDYLSRVEYVGVMGGDKWYEAEHAFAKRV